MHDCPYILFIIQAYDISISIRDGGEVSTTDLQKIVQALPQYGEQVEKLTLHIEVNDCFRNICIHILCSPYFVYLSRHKLLFPLFVRFREKCENEMIYYHKL